MQQMEKKILFVINHKKARETLEEIKKIISKSVFNFLCVGWRANICYKLFPRRKKIVPLQCEWYARATPRVRSPPHTTPPRPPPTGPTELWKTWMLVRVHECECFEHVRICTWLLCILALVCVWYSLCIFLCLCACACICAFQKLTSLYFATMAERLAYSHNGM